MEKSIDIVVLGATGFTGTCVVEKLAKLTVEKYWDVTWAIAGRSKEKLEKLIKDLNKAGLGTKNLTTFETDVQDTQSLMKVTQAARIVINCTGPHITLSPPIAKACIESGTHYMDLSIEMLQILGLYRDYNKIAEDENILLIPSCGFATVPAEAGMIYLDRQFEGTINTVECYAELLLPTIAPKVVLHSGTWTSVVEAMAVYRDHVALKAKIFPQPVEPAPPELKRPFLFRNNGKVWFPWPGIENDSVEMSQRYLNEKEGKKPVHFRAYTTLQAVYQFLAIPTMFIYYVLGYFRSFGQLLTSFPQLFTFGFVSEKGPSDKVRQDTRFRFVLHARGWDTNEDFKNEPTKTLSVKVSGRDPGYDATAVAATMCAITILKERSNMPKGGVIMPGAAFFKTGIVDRLNREGYRFKVLQEKTKINV